MRCSSELANLSAPCRVDEDEPGGQNQVSNGSVAAGRVDQPLALLDEREEREVRSSKVEVVDTNVAIRRLKVRARRFVVRPRLDVPRARPLISCRQIR